MPPLITIVSPAVYAAPFSVVWIHIPARATNNDASGSSIERRFICGTAGDLHRRQVRTIWSALVLDHRLQYINPPPSYFSQA